MDPMLDEALEGFDTTPRPNADQAEAIRKLEAGENVFLTGPAGVGKTFTLNQWLQGRGREGVAVTASTGIAATHIGGCTVHKWSGCGIAKSKASTIAGKWWWRERVAPYIKDTDVLIIDEISMLDGVTFELIGELCRRARKQPVGLPFGGLQLVLVGDMGQLSPVEEEERGFAFETDTWWDLDIQVVELTKVMRQRDAGFVQVLREVRDGTMSPRSYEILSSRVGAFDPEDQEAVRVMTHNAQVDRVNAARLDALPGEERVFEAIEEGDNPEAIKRLDKNCLSPRKLRLKENARVMLTKNHRGGLYVNGSLGHVVGWDEDYGDGAVVVALDDGGQVTVHRDEWVNTKTMTVKGGKPYEKVEARRVQFPLRLAWAITAHKVQGMTLGRVSVNLTHTFAPGQAYVALSRVKTLDGLNIEGWRGHESIIAHPTVSAFMRGEYVLPDPEPEEVTMDMSFGD